MTRDELIAALKAVTGPDRELDAEIAFQTGAFDRYLMGMNDCHIVSVKPAGTHSAEILIRADKRTTGGVQYNADLPRYTESIDAAITLVPEGCGWHTDHTIPDSVDWVVLPFALGDHREWKGQSTKPAIALCIAALKAEGST